MGLRQKTTRKQPQTQVGPWIYTKHQKIAETYIYQENKVYEVKSLHSNDFSDSKYLEVVNKIDFEACLEVFSI